jgi:hypothetical protein
MRSSAWERCGCPRYSWTDASAHGHAYHTAQGSVHHKGVKADTRSQIISQHTNPTAGAVAHDHVLLQLGVGQFQIRDAGQTPCSKSVLLRAALRHDRTRNITVILLAFSRFGPSPGHRGGSLQRAQTVVARAVLTRLVPAKLGRRERALPDDNLALGKGTHRKEGSATRLTQVTHLDVFSNNVFLRHLVMIYGSAADAN